MARHLFVRDGRLPKKELDQTHVFSAIPSTIEWRRGTDGAERQK